MSESDKVTLARLEEFMLKEGLTFVRGLPSPEEIAEARRAVDQAKDEPGAA